jgi:hypothetical protein
LTNGSDAMPIKELVTTIWPVDETGKNSVSPSMIARIMTWTMFIGDRSIKLIELSKLD